jgi:hypothetical protein
MINLELNSSELQALFVTLDRVLLLKETNDYDSLVSLQGKIKLAVSMVMSELDKPDVDLNVTTPDNKPKQLELFAEWEKQQNKILDNK